MKKLKGNLLSNCNTVDMLLDMLKKNDPFLLDTKEVLHIVKSILNTTRLAVDYIEAAEFEARVADTMFGAIAIEIVIQNARGDCEVDKATCLKRARLEVEAEMDKEK